MYCGERDTKPDVWWELCVYKCTDHKRQYVHAFDIYIDIVLNTNISAHLSNLETKM